jgi:hypothetical protein
MIIFCVVAIKRAKLAAALFAEAGKTVSKIPWILMQGIKILTDFYSSTN